MNAKLFAAVALAAALATGLSSTAALAQDKTAVFAVENTFASLDPYDTNVTLDLSVCKSFYQGLYTFDKDLKVTPQLADSYETAKAGLIYTFKLKKGIKFHDGTDFNAAAVKAVFDRVTNPENKLKRYNLFSNIDSTTVIDDYTVKITLKRPFSAFINQLAHPSAVMISPTALAKYGKQIGMNPVGTGPFKFVEWKQPDYVKVVKNDKYWKAGWPKLDAIIWKPVGDSNTRTAMLQAGEAHFTAPLPVEQAENLLQNPKLDVVSGPGIFAQYLSMNTLKKPFNDVRVRHAINYAINKEALAKVLYKGYATPAEGPVPIGVEYAVKTGRYEHNPAKARELLKAAGYPNGFETELWAANTSIAQKGTQFLQQQLAQVGIKAKITLMETGQRVQQLENVQKPEDAAVRLYFAGWSSSTGEADWGLRPLFATESQPPKLQNFAYYSNTEFDDLLYEALGTADREKKAKAYARAQEIVHKEAPWAFLVTRKVAYAKSKTLKGIYQMPDNSFFFEDVQFSK
ncbi:glutathione ABC transporter substrate-binding protein GsiB [Paucibacter sp. Y2R2-4]|uniref:glutathione ABC transporter substrate-binding protein GsiB n=1 Tax=Paucibacter sp. Y2R2-4 TaxID=2893553 RepID=UPI0021E37829|nr:glutathione ABC transporter substrate-binding protein GsiB [Paucibacter sp. Y2R2-4]MCV2348831.1 glutathione ABC transporter substrate-binding protein GsiB [Paucibacter sp. Y2R2-4]